MAAVLSVEGLWIGFEPGVEGVCVIANKGTPTEQWWSIKQWTAFKGGLDLAKRGAILISDSHGGIPQATPEQIKRMDS
jgi:hypothetical protein